MLVIGQRFSREVEDLVLVYLFIFKSSYVFCIHRSISRIHIFLSISCILSKNEWVVEKMSTNSLREVQNYVSVKFYACLFNTMFLSKKKNNNNNNV